MYLAIEFKLAFTCVSHMCIKCAQTWHNAREVGWMKFGEQCDRVVVVCSIAQWPSTRWTRKHGGSDDMEQTQRGWCIQWNRGLTRGGL